MNMITAMLGAIFDGVDIVKGTSVAPSLTPLEKITQYPADSLECAWQVFIIKREFIVGSLKSEEPQSQLQAIHRSLAHRRAVSPLEVRFFTPGILVVQRREPWPQRPALLDQRARPLACAIP